jgi:hypothetical protein
MLPGTPTRCPIKHENLESCLAIARKKIENEYGSSADTQFAVQITTEERVLSWDKMTPRYVFQANGREDEDKERGKRETFLEFMVKNSHLYSEQEDRPHQLAPCRPGYSRVMDMRTGLMFEVEKAGLPQKDK